MPTALERAGDFSKSFDLNGKLIPVKDPLTGTAFPGNRVPASRVNQYGLAIMNILPPPNYNGSGYNYLFQERYLNQPRQSSSERVDYRPTDADLFSVTIKTWNSNMSGIHVAAGSSLWGLVPMQYGFDALQGTVNYTRIINPHLVNEFMIGALHDREESPPLPPDGYDALVRDNRGLAGLGQYNNTWNPLNFIPKASFGGIPASFSSAAISYDGREPLSGFDMNITSTDNVTYTHGAHTFKAGVYFEQSRFGQAATSIFGGSFDFGNSSLDPTNTGYAFANAYLGHFASYTEDLGRGQDNSRRRTWAWFVQDTWKIARNLTMDIGLRMYQVNWPLQSNGVASNLSLERFDPTWGGNPPILFRPVSTSQGRRAVNPLNGQVLAASYIGTIVPGTGNRCDNLSNTNPCMLNGIVIQNDPTYVPGGGFRDPVGVQFDPRLGFSWDPFGDGKTAVRLSFGAFHQASTGGGGAFDRGPAFVYTRTLLSSDISPTTFQSTPVTSPVNVSGVYREQKIPVVYQYMFGIQRDLGKSTMLDVSYVGNTEHYVSQNWNYNYLPFGSRFKSQYADPTNTAVPLPDAFLRPNTGYLDMLMSGPATSTRYDALQAKIQRRFAVGVEIDANYSFSKTFQATGWSQQLAQSLFNGLASTDQTHVFNFSYVYDLPKASKVVPGKFTKWFLDDWRISGITTFASGFPSNIVLTTTDSYDFTGGGDIGAGNWQAVDRGSISSGTPMSIAGVRLSCDPSGGPRSFSQFFDTSCAHRPAGRGDYGSDFTGYKFRGPGFNNFDMSIFKSFPIREDKVFQFRWEVYNLFNHPEAMSVNNTARLDPAGNQVNAAFGTVTATRPERRMQGSLRFTF